MSSILRFSTARSSEEGTVFLVMVDKSLKVFSQYAWSEGHDQKVWIMSPLKDLQRQHVLGVWRLKDATLAGVKYHRSKIFCVSIR